MILKWTGVDRSGPLVDRSGPKRSGSRSGPEAYLFGSLRDRFEISLSDRRLKWTEVDRSVSGSEVDRSAERRERRPPLRGLPDVRSLRFGELILHNHMGYYTSTLQDILPEISLHAKSYIP